MSKETRTGLAMAMLIGGTTLWWLYERDAHPLFITGTFMAYLLIVAINTFGMNKTTKGGDANPQ